MEISGQEPGTILIPLQMDYLNWAIQNSLTIQLALQGFPGDIKVHYPPHKLFTFLYEWGLEEKPKCSEKPVLGCTVFTDGGGHSGKGAVIWKENGTWKHIMIKKEGSVQKIELQAVIEAFKWWATKPLNVVSDSLYVVGVVRRMERATLRHVNQEDLYQQFKTLWHLLEQRTEPYYITHIRSHTTLPGELSQGNLMADKLVAPVWAGPLPDCRGQAVQSHHFFHQSAKVLSKQYQISLTDAKGIVQSCLDCQQLGPVMVGTINPRGIHTLHLWQMDVTHVSEFGRLKYVHVSIDCFFHVVWATAQTEETSRHVKRHLQSAFMALGVPKKVKTDNGPVYVSKSMAEFFQTWGIKHITGIPHSPTGQAIIERMNQTLKRQLAKQKGGEEGLTPHERIQKAVYVLNFLSLPRYEDVPPIIKHVRGLQSDVGQIGQEAEVKVQIKDLYTGQWEGPVRLLM